MDTYIEKNCTFPGPNGQVYESGGAMITDDYVVAYMENKPGKAIREFEGLSYVVTDWHGNAIGRVLITGRWRIPGGVVSDCMISGRLTVDDGSGRTYNVRGAGFGMVIKGRRAKT